MKRISILNFKGGVGKTSISTNSAHKLALMGYKVLLIDCDIQANASNLIPQKDRKPTTLTHVLKGEATFEDTIQKARENLYLIAADSNLDKAANHIVISGIKGYKLLRNGDRLREPNWRFTLCTARSMPSKNAKHLLSCCFAVTEHL